MIKLRKKAEAAMDEAVSKESEATDRYVTALSEEDCEDAYREILFWQGVQDDVRLGVY